jgi:hypothetical protein
MNDLEKEVDEFKGAGETLREGLKLAKEEVQNSHARMEDLKNSSQDFWSEYR